MSLSVALAVRLCQLSYPPAKCLPDLLGQTYKQRAKLVDPPFASYTHLLPLPPSSASGNKESQDRRRDDDTPPLLLLPLPPARGVGAR